MANGSHLRRADTDRRPLLLVFVDGLGIGSHDPAVNPLCRRGCENLQRLESDFAVAVDACLGVPGLPQSATGQTALLTGVNAPRVIGRHVEGFPGPELRDIIRAHNIFAQLAARDLSSTFANGYFVFDAEAVQQARVQSVTTVATLAAFGAVRDGAALDRDEAVYQDLTRESLVSRGYKGRFVTPLESARHLQAIAATHDFTLFEYFQTDRAGHSRDFARAAVVLQRLDAFMGELTAAAAEGAFTLVMTSDHGNIEDMRTHRHTRNPCLSRSWDRAPGNCRQVCET